MCLASDSLSGVARARSLGGGGKEGLVSTSCTYAIIIMILNNPITYGYCLVYLPYDLNASYSTYLEMAGLDSLNFERDFEVARTTLSEGL